MSDVQFERSFEFPPLSVGLDDFFIGFFEVLLSHIDAVTLMIIRQNVVVKVFRWALKSF